MISEKMFWNRIEEGIFGNDRMDYCTEFDLYIDILLIVYMCCANILF